MGWNRRDEDWQADRFRDERKHDPRPGDRGFSAPGNEVPERLSPPIAGAMEVALIVKGLDNVTTAASLIEQYAQAIAAAARLDGVEATLRKFDEAFAGASHAKV